MPNPKDFPRLIPHTSITSCREFQSHKMSVNVYDATVVASSTFTRGLYVFNRVTVIRKDTSIAARSIADYDVKVKEEGLSGVTLIRKVGK